MTDGSLYVDPDALTNASGDLTSVANALSQVSELVKAAGINLADYDSPQYSAEIKSALQNWLNQVGDPDVPNPDTMIGRMRGFATFLTEVASSYTA